MCDSHVLVTGVSSIVDESIATPSARMRTLEALRHLSHSFDDVPPDRLEKAFWFVQQRHGQLNG